MMNPLSPMDPDMGPQQAIYRTFMSAILFFFNIWGGRFIYFLWGFFCCFFDGYRYGYRYGFIRFGSVDSYSLAPYLSSEIRKMPVSLMVEELLLIYLGMSLKTSFFSPRIRA